MNRSRNIFLTIRNAAIRAGWGVLLLSHLYWLFRSFGSTTVSIGSQIMLGPTCVFLALKTLDVACLRFRCTRLALVAAVLVVVVMHVGVVDRIAGDATDATPWILPIVVGAVACMRQEIVERIRRVIMRLAIAFGNPCPNWTRHYWHIVAGVRACSDQRYCVTLRTPRAPPV